MPVIIPVVNPMQALNLRPSVFEQPTFWAGGNLYYNVKVKIMIDGKLDMMYSVP